VVASAPYLFLTFKMFFLAFGFPPRPSRPLR